MKVKFQALREFETDWLIIVLYCPTEEQLADLMRKIQPKIKFEVMKNKLGMTEAKLEEEW